MQDILIVVDMQNALNAMKMCQIKIENDMA